MTLDEIMAAIDAAIAPEKMSKPDAYEFLGLIEDQVEVRMEALKVELDGEEED